MTKEIQLTRGLVAIVDDADFERVNQFRWCAHGGRDGRTWYAKRAPSIGGGRQVTVLMHRFIMDAPGGLQVDHRNGNGLDNQRANLRLCTLADNRRNRGSYPGSISDFKGVSWHNDKWMARIGVNGRYEHLGYFDTPEEAALAYDSAALAYHGEYARLNFPNAKRAQMQQPDAQPQQPAANGVA